MTAIVFVRVLTFTALTYTCLVVLGGLSELLGLPIEVGLPQWAPGCAGLLMLLIFPNDEHRMIFYDPSTPIRRYLVAVAIPLGAGLLIYLLCRQVDIDDADSSSGLPPGSNRFIFFLLTPIGALGEEIGWRGYLHKRLEREGLRGITSSLITGIIWTGIHIPIFQAAGSALYVALSCSLVLCLATVLYLVAYDADFSILICTIFHPFLNWTSFLYVDRFFMVEVIKVVAFVWFVAAMVFVVSRRDLYFAPKITTSLHSECGNVSQRAKSE